MDYTTEILEKANDTINQRAAIRDTPRERSMKGTVEAFNALYGTNLTESQGWQFMVLLKIKRGAQGIYREDDFIDQAAYSSLAAEAKKAESYDDNLKVLAEKAQKTAVSEG